LFVSVFVYLFVVLSLVVGSSSSVGVKYRISLQQRRPPPVFFASININIHQRCK
jgi:hypothetical protein